jgi:hypothetical protein
MPPEPLPAVLPSSSGRKPPPAWLKPALPATGRPLPRHDPASPLLEAFRTRLSEHPYPDSAFQDEFLHSMEHGFGRVSPTGCSSHRSEPANSAKSLEHQDLLRANFAKLASASPPLAYGPFPDRPPFPVIPGDPQPIVSPLSVAFKGEKWKDLDPFIDPEAKANPGYLKSIGKGSARAVQNGTAPPLEPKVSKRKRPALNADPRPAASSAPPPKGSKRQRPAPFRGARWSLNSRVHFAPIRQVFASARSIAELLAFFGPGTVVIQTDFPAAYKICRLPKGSLFAHVSKTVTIRDGKEVVEYWVDAAQIFGSGHAPIAWELFVIIFEHLLRSHHPCLSLTIHFVDNLYTFIPAAWLQRDANPNRLIGRISKALFSYFDEFPQPHHDDHVGSSFPALGHYFHSLPSPAIGLKPARAPIIQALFNVVIKGLPIPPRLGIATHGMFSWLSTSVPGVSFASPAFAKLEHDARLAIRRNLGLVDIPPMASHALRALSFTDFWSRLSGHNAEDASNAIPITAPFQAFQSSPITAVLRCDASPHFGCGGYSITARLFFHSAWNHEPHSPEALAISSTLAEAIAALILVRAFARAGVNVLQTDSDNLRRNLIKGFTTCWRTNLVIALMFAHCAEIGATLLPVHLHRGHNRASDRLAANASFKTVAPLIQKETGIPLPEIMRSFTRVITPSAHSTLAAIPLSSVVS